MRLAGKRRVGNGLYDRFPGLLPGNAPGRWRNARALEACVLPLGILLDGADEEQVHASGVRSVALDVLVRRDRVALGLRHLGAVAIEHPLREQPRERLAEPDQPEIVHHLHEEACVQQMQDRVLDSADVLVDGSQ